MTPYPFKMLAKRSCNNHRRPAGFRFFNFLCMSGCGVKQLTEKSQ